jgi:hypothetical protein
LSSRRHYLEVAFVVLIIAAAVGMRLGYLTQRPFWVDEAESSVNALTILESGLPSDRYLGIPIYENTLIKPWPGNPEYEFRDISYSDRGLATYHGWLPLYSMAASFAVFHVTPDRAASGPVPHRTLEELKRRTWVARIPSVLFSAVFLALCYWGGLSLLGRDAGLTALLVGCIHQTQMDISTTARYYSATVALSTAAVLCLWLILTKGRWRHYGIGAGVFALLFYTHLVTFAAAVFVFGAVAVYLVWRARDSLPKLLLFSGLVVLLTVPWIFATGFLSGLGSAPPARLLLSFPGDLVSFPPARAVYLVLFAGFLLATLCTWPRRFRPAARMRSSFHECLPAVVLLSLWIASGYTAFMLLIPAASFFPERLNLSYWGPALLLGSVFCAGLARVFTRRFSIVAAPLVALLLLGLTGHDLRGEPSPDEHYWTDLLALTAYLDHREIPSATRLYASPNDHLSLTFYTGRPFQSMAPVRKSFLETYRGDILYVERTYFVPSTQVPMPDGVEPEETSDGRCPEEGAQRPADLWRTLPYRWEVNTGILGVSDDSDSLLTLTEREGRSEVRLPIFRGYRTVTPNEWRAAFFYRFVDPASRSGRHSNYAGRLRGARADLLTASNWAIYYSKFHDAPSAAGVTFRVLP